LYFLFSEESQDQSRLIHPDPIFSFVTSSATRCKIVRAELYFVIVLKMLYLQCSSKHPMTTLSMAKKKLFTADYEIHASIKMLYPYIQSAGGLAEWFADDVTINNEDKTYTFFWDNEDHKARQVAHRTNHFARFEFVPESEEDVKDPSYFELRLEFNELTQSVFLKVFDYSDFTDVRELQDLWDSLIEALRKTVGG
jgi:hypothetical protein